MALKPMFTMGQINTKIDRFISEKQEKIIQGFSVFGEEFVNNARPNKSGKNYRDRTGNLRSSVGYVVGKNKSKIKQDLTGGSLGKPEGINAAKKLAEQVLAGEPKNSITLVGVAGMEYANAVESKGYSVITPYVPRAEDIRAFFKETGLVE